jgi:hypothetical protein
MGDNFYRILFVFGITGLVGALGIMVVKLFY